MFVNARSVRRLVSGALITTAILMIFGPPKPVSAQPANGTPVIPVTVTNVVRSDVPVWLRGLGTVQANFAVQIRPRVDGALSQVPVKEGQDVKKGDLLAVIDPRTYQAALNVVTAKRQQDQAQLVNAQADLARYASLARQDFASRQQLETQQAVVKQLSAAILGDGAQVEAAQLNLSFCYILSPFDGRIGLRNVDPGNIVRSAETTSILSVTQIQPISVIFTLPQDSLPSVMRAMEKKPLNVVAYAGDNKTELERGILLTPDNTIDTTTGTIKMKATFPNAHQTLWPGQFVNIRLLLGTEANVIAVASSSVQHGPNGLYVYRVGPNNTVAVQPIQIARQEDSLYIVSDGLTEGAVVVASGQSRLQAGSRVTVRETQAVPESIIKSGS